MDKDKIINGLVIFNIIVFSVLFLTLIPGGDKVYSITYLGNDTYEILCLNNVREQFTNDTIYVCGNVPLHPVEEEENYLDDLEFSLLNVSK